ncbi:MAG: GNAT family N-acetyltransferase [Bifidobacteriaceae bacterium]|nr:GNAT family N-acetyltransferase [Bifidobacteriaceae bacterium]
MKNLVKQAYQAADGAAQAAGVRVAMAVQTEDYHDIADLLAVIWPTGEAGHPPVEPNLLQAIGYPGNYVSAALDGRGKVIGACMGFFGAPAHNHHHSHIAGVLPDHEGRGIGRALKLHQRAWVLERGVTHMSWTFDPLVARNAHFNLTRLGGRAAAFLENFYGHMSDGRNAGQESDRIMVEWELDSPAVQALADGAAPVEPDHVGSIAVPADIEAIRQADPEQAVKWRIALREELQDAFDQDLQIVGFDRHDGYLLARTPA